MSTYENSFVQIEPDTLHVAAVMADKTVEKNSPRDTLLRLAVSVDLINQRSKDVERGSRYVFGLHDPTMLTEDEHEALNRVFEALSKHLDINASVRFKMNSSWCPDDPVIFEPKEVPTVSSMLSNYGGYLSTVDVIDGCHKDNYINHYLLFIFLSTIALIKSAPKLCDDVFVLHLIRHSSDPYLGNNLSIESEQLIETVLDEVSQVSKKRFSFNTRLADEVIYGR